jgi:hypothetical protein
MPCRAGPRHGAAEPTPAHPAGLYERAGALRAINLEAGDGFAEMGSLPSGIAISDYTVAAPRDLAGMLFTSALVLLLDRLHRGTRHGRRLDAAAGPTARRGQPGVAAFGAGGRSVARRPRTACRRPTAFAMRAALDTRLAYVLTGDQPDRRQYPFAGLAGLTDFLSQRSSIEAESPMAIDIERDEIVFFPIIYWPVTPEAEVPSPRRWPGSTAS